MEKYCTQKQHINNFIVVEGARVHNLKNCTCRIPHNQLTVVTGPSGSGKSSLAFDTLYAEGQRRFLESLSSYARQFFDRMEKPDVDAIHHLRPAVAMEQKNGTTHARSTVGTTTEIDDYLRLLFSAHGTPHCPQCQQAITTLTVQAAAQHWVQNGPELNKGYLLLQLSPAFWGKFSIADCIRQGYDRAYDESNQAIIELSADTSPEQQIQPEWLVLDRLILKNLSPEANETSQARLRDAMAQAIQAFDVAKTFAWVSLQADTHALTPLMLTPLTLGLTCQGCGKVFQPCTPHQFSFNHPQGACSHCEGFGRVMGLDWDKIIPNHNLSLSQGAIAPFTTPAHQSLFEDLMAEAQKQRLRTDVPVKNLTEGEWEFVRHGCGRYPGILPFFAWLEGKTYKVHVRVFLSKYRAYTPCSQCHGSRLKAETNWIKIEQHTWASVQQSPVHVIRHWIDQLPRHAGNQRLVEELSQRLGYLCEVGLGYLTLQRPMRTLSGGEAQRIHLSSALGARLTNTLYVLDEPTVGLHVQDTHRLIGVLQQLCQRGNTVVVVEHDPDVIRAADYLIDMGPQAGENGGTILFEGRIETLLAQKSQSKTAMALSDNFVPHANPNFLDTNTRMSTTDNPSRWIGVTGATGHCLKNVSLSIPKNRLVVVTGVSGSGKSSLIRGTLYANHMHPQGRALDIERLPVERLTGLDSFQDVLLIDQSPLGRSARSNPATYTKVWDSIRQLFAKSRQAKVLGIGAGDFSFNVVGGRCEACEGMGTQTIDMQFLADVTLTCPDCSGKRFKPHVLSVTWEGQSIYDVLNMTVDRACEVFAAQASILQSLHALQKLGLGYLRLGQSTATLSGGEAQRLKLSSFLQASASSSIADKPVLFLFDEPTTGLHVSDVQVLLQALHTLRDKGHSVVVIEHHVPFMAQADWLIELGPEGGEGGGYLLAQGTPSAVSQQADSVIGPYLQPYLATPVAH